MGRVLLSLAASLVLAGCPRGDAPTDAAPDGALYTFLSDGAGPTNAAPLWPLRVGSRFDFDLGGSGDNSNTQYIDGTTTLHGATVHRRHSTGGTTWLAEHEAGVFHFGSSIDGRFAHPALVVPAQVRVGMAWEVDRDGDGTADGAYEVTGASPDELTPFGRATVWSVVEGGQVERRYAEGYGIVGINTVQLRSAVLPDADQPGVPAPGEPVPMVPISGESVLDGFEVHGVSAVQWWDDEMTLTLAGHGLLPPAYTRVRTERCVQLRWFPGRTEVTAEVDHDGWGNALGVSTLPARRCPSSSPVPNDREVTGHASAARVEGQQATWLLRDRFGALDRPPDSTIAPFLLYEHPTDGPRAHWVGTNQAEGGRFRLEDLDGVMLAESRGRPLNGLPRHRLYPRWDDPLLGARTIHPLAASEQGLPLGLQFGDGLLLHSWVPLDEPAQAAQIAGFSGGWLSGRVTPAEREVLTITSDGVIERLVPERDGVRVERIATVRVPEGHQAVGAVRFPQEQRGDHLVVLTYAGERMPVQGSAGAIGGRALHLWLAAQPDLPPQAYRAPPSLTVTVAAAHEDAVVCWGSTSEPLEREGWTLGGAPAATVISTGDGCAVLVRDHDAADPAETLGGYRVSGPVPGVGPIRTASPSASDLAQRWSLWFRTDAALAPLAGGGFAGRVHTLRPGAISAEQHGLWGATPPTIAEVPDAAGQGLWTVSNAGNASSLSLRGSGSDLTAHDGVGEAAIVGWVQGGGVLLRTNTGIGLQGWAVAPDGGMTSTELLAAHLADGTRCGLETGTLTCVGPGGEEVSAALGVEPAFGVPLRFLPTGELVLHDQGGQLHRIDPVTLSVSALDPRPVHHLAWGADGSLWGVVQGETTVVEVTSSGLDELPPVVIPARYPNDDVLGLLVDEEVVVLVIDGGDLWPVAIRVVRP